MTLQQHNRQQQHNRRKQLRKRRRIDTICFFLGIFALVKTAAYTVSAFTTPHRLCSYNTNNNNNNNNNQHYGCGHSPIIIHNRINVEKSDPADDRIVGNRCRLSASQYQQQQLRLKSKPSNTETTTTTTTTTDSSSNNSSNALDDTILLNSVTLEQLQALCDQCHIPYDVVNESDENYSSGDVAVVSQGLDSNRKVQLLRRLRQHANTQADIEQQRYLSRKSKVENQFNNDDENYNSKERYEIVGNDVDDLHDDDNDNENDDQSGYFFFDLPTISDDLKQAQIESKKRDQSTNTGSSSSSSGSSSTGSKSSMLTSDQVTAPPPPSTVNSNGERVVKIYSTTELNDLTSIAASQPGQNSILTSSSLDTVARSNSGQQQQSWDYSEQQSSMATNSQYIEQAKEKLAELVSTLLALSGAPGFSNPSGDDDDDDEDMGRILSVRRTNIEFAGFNPSKVPVELLTSSSKAIRASRGEVLDEVLRNFEIQGIGYDGIAGDNTSSGGGHYREVQKVRAFVEGYRRAEVRRLARETTSMLLNKIMIEGIDSLDMTLNTMIRSNDDTEDEFGGTQLNDSLIDYLNDVIRQKEKEVQTRYGDRQKAVKTWTDQLLLHDDNDDDDLDQYWNVTELDGQRIETFDPKNEQVKQIIQLKMEQQQTSSETTPLVNRRDIPETAPEQVLLLLKLLRERIKAEAAFASDEKGRNLRLLAYCLHLDTEDEREQFILKQLGNSLDRLDSFIELVTSSIEYGESTSYELQPATTSKTKLDVQELRQILQLSMELRHRQSIKASGIRQR